MAVQIAMQRIAASGRPAKGSKGRANLIAVNMFVPRTGVAGYDHDVLRLVRVFRKPTAQRLRGRDFDPFKFRDGHDAPVFGSRLF